jgi:gas vesicle protein
MLKMIGRLLVLIVAVLVILLSLSGIVGAWWVNSVASNVTLKVFSVVQSGVEVVNTAVGRVDTLIQTARTEVQQAGETVTTIAGNLQENHPVLTALSDRLETRLGPAVDNIQEAIAPVHDALTTVSSAVSFANSIPFIQERAPRLEQLDQTFTRLGSLAADVQQLRSTLRAAVVAGADKLTQTTATALTDLTSRIDAGLADIQSSVQTLQSDITALQARLQERQSQLLLIYNLSALAATLLFAWVIYSQVVVVRHHWSRSRNAAPKPVSPEPVVATASTGVEPPPSSTKIVAGAAASSVAPAQPEHEDRPETGSGTNSAR